MNKLFAVTGVNKMNVDDLLNSFTKKQKQDINKYMKENGTYELIGSSESKSKIGLFLLGWFAGRNAMYEESLEPGEGE